MSHPTAISTYVLRSSSLAELIQALSLNRNSLMLRLWIWWQIFCNCTLGKNALNDCLARWPDSLLAASNTSKIGVNSTPNKKNWTTVADAFYSRATFDLSWGIKWKFSAAEVRWSQTARLYFPVRIGLVLAFGAAESLRPRLWPLGIYSQSGSGWSLTLQSETDSRWRFNILSGC